VEFDTEDQVLFFIFFPSKISRLPLAEIANAKNGGTADCSKISLVWGGGGPRKFNSIYKVQLEDSKSSHYR